jgi:hypothetical protein
MWSINICFTHGKLYKQILPRGKDPVGIVLIFDGLINISLLLILTWSVCMDRTEFALHPVNYYISRRHRSSLCLLFGLMWTQGMNGSHSPGVMAPRSALIGCLLCSPFSRVLTVCPLQDTCSPKQLYTNFTPSKTLYTEFAFIIRFPTKSVMNLVR